MKSEELPLIETRHRVGDDIFRNRNKTEGKIKLRKSQIRRILEMKKIFISFKIENLRSIKKIIKILTAEINSKSCFCMVAHLSRVPTQALLRKATGRSILSTV